jgi:hypothetical protein
MVERLMEAVIPPKAPMYSLRAYRDASPSEVFPPGPKIAGRVLAGTHRTHMHLAWASPPPVKLTLHSALRDLITELSMTVSWVGQGLLSFAIIYGELCCAAFSCMEWFPPPKDSL